VRSIEIHQRAEMNLVAACEWYEAQQPGLSKKFRNEVEFKIQLIAANPELYSTKHNNHLRFAPLRKYPYIVVTGTTRVWIAYLLHRFFTQKGTLKSLSNE